MPARRSPGAKDPASVDAYITAGAIEHQPILRELRSLIQAAMPNAIEAIGSSGFPVYSDGGGAWLAGFAARKQGPMLYIMNKVVLDAHSKALGQLRTGNSCIMWKATPTLSLADLRALAGRLLREAAA